MSYELYTDPMFTKSLNLNAGSRDLGSLSPSSAAFNTNQVSKLNRTSVYESDSEGATRNIQAVESKVSEKFPHALLTGKMTFASGLYGTGFNSLLSNAFRLKFDESNTLIQNHFRAIFAHVAIHGASITTDDNLANLVAKRRRYMVYELQSNMQLFLLNQRDIVAILKKVFADFPAVLEIIRGFENSASTLSNGLTNDMLAGRIAEIFCLSTGWTESEFREYAGKDALLPDMSILDDASKVTEHLSHSLEATLGWDMVESIFTTPPPLILSMYHHLLHLLSVRNRQHPCTLLITLLHMEIRQPLCSSNC